MLVFVGDWNTQILLVKNAKLTARIQDNKFEISSLKVKRVQKNPYDTTLTTKVSPPKRAYNKNCLYLNNIFSINHLYYYDRVIALLKKM